MAKPLGPQAMLPERPMLAARHAYFTGQLSRADFVAAMGAYNEWVAEHGESCGAAGATELPDVPEYPDEDAEPYPGAAPGPPGGPPAVRAVLPATGAGEREQAVAVGAGEPWPACIAQAAAAGRERLSPLQQRWVRAERMASLGRHLVALSQRAHAEVVHELTDHTALQLTEVAQLLGVPYAEVRRAYHRGLGHTCSPG